MIYLLLIERVKNPVHREGFSGAISIKRISFIDKQIWNQGERWVYGRESISRLLPG
jgi:hypothetical protein